MSLRAKARYPKDTYPGKGEGGLTGDKIKRVNGSLEVSTEEQVVQACARVCVRAQVIKQPGVKATACGLTSVLTLQDDGEVIISLFCRRRYDDCRMIPNTEMDLFSVLRGVEDAYGTAHSALEQGQKPQAAVDKIIDDPNLGVRSGTLTTNT